MSEIAINYKGAAIATMDASGTKTLETEGKYCEDDIEVVYTKPAGPSGTKSINTNGTHDVTAYASADVNVPNSYAAGDEGKVVSNGALVAQSSDTVTQNDTYDTTLINSLTVNVSGGGSVADINALVSGSLSGDLTYTATNIGRCFSCCSGTFSLNFPNAVSVTQKGYLMEQCDASFIRMPEVTGNLASNMIAASNKLTLFFAPKATASANSLSSASLLQTVVIGSVGTSYQQMNSNPSLKTVDILTSTGRLDNTWQTNCGAMDTLILRGDSVLTLHNVSAFGSTAFKSGGTGGTIYIPESLYNHLGDGTSSDYKAATNWSTLDGYGTITWAKIEGSYYETHYADGTAIPTT